MKNSKGLFEKLKYGDFIVVGLVIAVSLVLFAFNLFSSEKLVAEIYLEGEPVNSVELYSLQESKVLEVGSCEILLEADGAAFISSECEDRLCINRGKLKKAGDTMACVPERVTLVLKGAKNEVDAVVF